MGDVHAQRAHAEKSGGGERGPAAFTGRPIVLTRHSRRSLVGTHSATPCAGGVTVFLTALFLGWLGAYASSAIRCGRSGWPRGGEAQDLPGSWHFVSPLPCG